MKRHRMHRILFLFLLISQTSQSQDTIRKVYRPWISNQLYTRIDKAKWNNSVIKVVDLKGNTRFVGQVFGDCGSYNGETREYFSRNRIKKIEKYSSKVSNGCPLKNGTWIYYDKKGNVRKKIVYEDGLKKS
jgi:hypothetical protein